MFFQKKKMQSDLIETRELDLSGQDVPEGALKPNTNWLLLDDTMFLETSNMPVLTQETYEKINSQFSPDEKSLVLNDLKLKFGLADSDFKNEIAKGPYHLVTTLLPGIEGYRPGKILTIKAATPDSLPFVWKSSGGIKCSSIQGVETGFKVVELTFANSKYFSIHC